MIIEYSISEKKVSELMSIKEASDNIIFSINIEDLQNESLEYIGRKLDEEEIFFIKDKLVDAINDGLMFIFPDILNNLENVRCR